MERIFEYAIIRLVPFAHRGERLNVGLLIFLDDRLDVRMHTKASVLRTFGAQAHTTDWLARHLVDVDDPNISVEDRWHLLAGSAGFTLSERGWFSAESEEQYENRIAEVLADYVERPSPFESRKRRSNLMSELRSQFRVYDLLGRHPDDLKRHKIVSNIPVGPAGKLHIDFLLKNGNFHATETIDFRHSEDAGTAELKEAALASFTLKYAREQLGSNSTKCYLVYAAPAVVEKAIMPALSLAETSVDELFNMESKEDKANYIDRILSAAGTDRLNLVNHDVAH